MSRGFVKEDDQEDLPMVPPRAHLPEGITNYVTKVGMDQLLGEKKALTDEKLLLDNTDEKERRIAQNLIAAKLQLLTERIATAKIVDLEEQPAGEVRFGATVTLQAGAAREKHTYQIVGVDEADIAKGKISFISPLARILIQKKTGDTAVLKLASGDKTFEILDIAYKK